jgi:hypothetical protein
MKVALDFAPGLHGHFLEYVCNRYIFKVPFTKQNIFQSSGACHPINVDSVYQKNKIVIQGHYSSFNLQYPADTTQIIFVKHNSIFDLILLTNMFYRCHPNSINVDDFNVDVIKSLQLDLMFNDVATDQQLRNNWYSKLTERHFEMTEKKQLTNLETYNFDYGSFFQLDQFLLELKKVADFLGNTFVFDKSLVVLWKEFISYNQGYQLYNNGNYLFDQIVSNNSSSIGTDWKLQAYLNYKISSTFKLYDHPDLFKKEEYPSNTKQIYELIMCHVENYDKKFG